jgi:hypothetical protein
MSQLAVVLSQVPFDNSLKDGGIDGKHDSSTIKASKPPKGHIPCLFCVSLLTNSERSLYI